MTKARDLSVVNGKAYLTTNGGLEVLDASDPSDLHVIGGYTVSDTFRPVSLGLGPAVAVLAGSRGLEVVDIKDPTSPSLIEHVDGPTSGKDTLVLGDVAFVADGNDGLRVYDLSDLTSVTEIGRYANLGDLNMIAANDRLLVVTADGGAISIFVRAS